MQFFHLLQKLKTIYLPVEIFSKINFTFKESELFKSYLDVNQNTIFSIVILFLESPVTFYLVLIYLLILHVCMMCVATCARERVWGSKDNQAELPLS